MPDSRISLDGAWEFLHVADDRLSGPAEIRQIAVPAPWQAQFADLRMRAGIGIYRRIVRNPGGLAHATASGCASAPSSTTRAS